MQMRRGKALAAANAALRIHHPEGEQTARRMPYKITAKEGCGLDAGPHIHCLVLATLGKR